MLEMGAAPDMVVAIAEARTDNKTSTRILVNLWRRDGGCRPS